MTREALLLDLCPTDCIGEKCEQFDCEDVCYPMLRRMFDKYDKQIRADAIDEVIQVLDKYTQDLNGKEIWCQICNETLKDWISSWKNALYQEIKEKNECG